MRTIMDKMNYVKIVKTITLYILWVILLFGIYKCVLYKKWNKVATRPGVKLNNKTSLWEGLSPEHNITVRNYFQKRQDWITSNLGSIMFKNGDYKDFKKRNKNFTVLIYKRAEWLLHRYYKVFGEVTSNPLQNCSVKNCIFTGNESLIEKVDAVLINIKNAKIPQNVSRKPEQIWIFAIGDVYGSLVELGSKTPDIFYLANVFNWSMHYRHDADVPVPYGRVVALGNAITEELYLTYNEDYMPVSYTYDYQKLDDLVPGWTSKRRDVLVAILYSNCLPRRRAIIKELSKYIEVHEYGQCSTDIVRRSSCYGSFTTECKPMSEYLFYLVIEESKCAEYLTEKIFFHAYAKGLIPIIIGPSMSDCRKLLPSLSFIHIESYPSLRDLAESLIKIASNEAKLFTYHKWRNNFAVLNEHGYFGTEGKHYCRICEALNYNDNSPSVYNLYRLRPILDLETDCS